MNTYMRWCYSVFFFLLLLLLRPLLFISFVSSVFHSTRLRNCSLFLCGRVLQHYLFYGDVWTRLAVSRHILDVLSNTICRSLDQIWWRRRRLFFKHLSRCYSTEIIKKKHHPEFNGFLFFHTNSEWVRHRTIQRFLCQIFTNYLQTICFVRSNGIFSRRFIFDALAINDHYSNGIHSMDFISIYFHILIIHLIGKCKHLFIAFLCQSFGEGNFEYFALPNLFSVLFRSFDVIQSSFQNGNPIVKLFNNYRKTAMLVMFVHELKF